jgi:hypothetical protein
MDEATRTRIAEKVVHPDTLDHEITPLYTDPNLRWRRTVVLPYGGAYRQAYDSFKKVMEEQARHYQEMDKLKFEFAMSALAITGGSVLTAVFASSALKVAAKETALDYVCRRNMERTFAAMHLVETNPVPSFIAGQVWDAAEKAALDGIKKRLEPGTGNYTGLQQAIQKPEDVLENLEKFNLDLRERGIDFILYVRSLTIPREGKVRIVKKALQSSYLSPPRIEIDKQGLVPKIELALFMQMITYSDKIRHRSYTAGRDLYNDIAVKTTAANYPKRHRHLNGSPPRICHVDVAMPGVGWIVMKRIDALHAKLYSGAKFFTSGEYWDWEFTNGEVKAIVSRAESRLEMLAKDGQGGMAARGQAAIRQPAYA